MAITKKWTESIKVSEGRHLGEIFHLEERPVTKGKETYSYLDIFVKITDAENNPEIKYSVPNTPNISEASKLGKVLTALGEKFVKNAELDIEKALIGKKVSVMIMTNAKGYSDIVEDSIKAA